jgi:hypothetical protein
MRRYRHAAVATLWRCFLVGVICWDFYSYGHDGSTFHLVLGLMAAVSVAIIWSADYFRLGGK